MSTSNAINLFNLDGRYATPGTLTTAIANQASIDANQYQLKTNATGNVVSGLSSGSSAASANGSLIQAAINNASSAGGGTVYIPTGTWYSSPFTLKSYVTLAGFGWGSILTLANSANTDFITLSDGLQVQTVLRDIRIDGNKSNQTTGSIVVLDNTAYSATGTGLDIRDPDHVMQRVLLINGKTYGLSLAGGLSQSQLDKVFAYQCDTYAFNVLSPDNHFINCIAAMSGKDNFYIAGNSNRFVNCKSWLAGQIDASNGSGFRVATVSRIDLIGCEAQDNRQHGYSLNSTDTANVSGCRADRNGLGADSNGYAGDGIYAYAVTNSRIDVVAGDRNSGGLKQRWAYNIGGNCDGNVVTITSNALAGGQIGNGSWGPNSIVNLIYSGKPVPQADTPIASTVQTAAYTLAASDANTIVEVNAATAVNITIPANSTVAFPVGTVIEVAQYGAGQVTFVAASGVTVRARGGASKTYGQYAAARLRQRAANEWMLDGDIT